MSTLHSYSQHIHLLGRYLSTSKHIEPSIIRRSVLYSMIGLVDPICNTTDLGTEQVTNYMNGFRLLMQ